MWTRGFATLLALIPLALAQQSEWGQCGGIGWTGATTCVSGTVCTVINSYYSQCLPGTASTVAPSSTTSASSPGSTSGSGSSGSGLNTLAKAAGKLYFGSATDNSELSDTAYVAILKNNAEFGQITPANSMKWDATEPQRGVFTFSGGDQIATFAEGNSQLLRGHNCVWYNQLPSWVSSGGFNAATLTSILQTHCSTIVEHYAGKICKHTNSWDVVNEAIGDDGNMRSFVFQNTIGTSYINTAFQAARGADPNAKLYINDYNIEQAGAKQTTLINLVKSLKAEGVPIDGIGLQCHFIVNEIPNLQSTLQTMTALGVEVAITELDIRMTLPSTQTLLSQQQANYQTVVAACKAVTGCVGITIWDYTDKYSWVPNTFSGQGAALPWDQNLAKKPAYSGIVSALS
ncbi:glycoside hydrolase family 10 [Pyrrhoderma noxium]|uniref:Beta-xylanase n=1 Tax=Pyrrhoderma noxium TaxID=2282107 RepID=A0A286UAU6_9AGAM|nr:glycoside hydrolase family 10 [Pyrrhoderma noxium]